MDAKLKADWVAALRSGEFTQYCGDIGYVEAKCLCCLGVGAVVANPAVVLFDTADAVEELSKHGFPGFDPHVDGLSFTVNELIELNDERGKSFAEIADWIEANL